MSYRKIICEGTLLAEIVLSEYEPEVTTFLSSPNSKLQLGVMSHPQGFVENAHYHPELDRGTCATQQFFVVTRGEIDLKFYSNSGTLHESVTLRVGDAALIIAGVHSIHVKENSRCLTVKQGPFLGAENDKIEVKLK